MVIRQTGQNLESALTFRVVAFAKAYQKSSICAAIINASSCSYFTVAEAFDMSNQAIYIKISFAAKIMSLMNTRSILSILCLPVQN